MAVYVMVMKQFAKGDIRRKEGKVVPKHAMRPCRGGPVWLHIYVHDLFHILLSLWQTSGSTEGVSASASVCVCVYIHTHTHTQTHMYC